MTIHAMADGAQIAVLHVVAAGLTATSIAGAFGLLSVIVATMAGLMAMAAYSFTIMDSPSFQRFLKKFKRD